MKLRKNLLLALAASLTLVSALPGYAAAAPADYTESKILNITPMRTQINYIPDVVYEQVPTRGYQSVAMMMDILQPESKTKMPAIVYVTGGGFINANRTRGIQERMHFAENGYVVASITYRAAPTSQFPAPVRVKTLMKQALLPAPLIYTVSAI